MQAPLSRRVAVAAPLVLLSLYFVALAVDGWSQCSDTPCIALFMLLTPLALAQAGGAVVLGWLATSPDRVLRWGGRLLGGALFLAQVCALLSTL